MPLLAAAGGATAPPLLPLPLLPRPLHACRGRGGTDAQHPCLVQNGGRHVHQAGSGGGRHAVAGAEEAQATSGEVEIHIKILEQLLRQVLRCTGEGTGHRVRQHGARAAAGGVRPGRGSRRAAAPAAAAGISGRCGRAAPAQYAHHAQHALHRVVLWVQVLLQCSVGAAGSRA